MKQTLRARHLVIRCIGLPERIGDEQYEAECYRINYHQMHNAEAFRRRQKKRLAKYLELGIDPYKINSVEAKLR